ncbi:hypothetical protein Ddye_022259 [Dipteronia dyeriana]|uniref:FLZ-type domain-containing protein n=1 Tax=Dipteronia dyeriana TaxID=168575 RepID=A0AAD9U3A1_9ROSI|nr:hypothetical protein Ddye_022259 [Dipteronia dyeriana]
MSRMRSRGFRSSSQGELTVFNQLRPFDYSPVDFFEKKRKALATAVKPPEEKPRPQVTFTIGDSDSEDNDSRSKKKVDEGFCAFLKNCSLCKKKFEKKKDFYMYGYLQAFCSPDCREDQIALDGFYEEVEKETISLAMSKQGFGGTRKF